MELCLVGTTRRSETQPRPVSRAKGSLPSSIRRCRVDDADPHPQSRGVQVLVRSADRLAADTLGECWAGPRISASGRGGRCLVPSSSGRSDLRATSDPMAHRHPPIRRKCPGMPRRAESWAPMDPENPASVLIDCQEHRHQCCSGIDPPEHRPDLRPVRSELVRLRVTVPRSARDRYHDGAGALEIQGSNPA
jgi:hypothetical protein